MTRSRGASSKRGGPATQRAKPEARWIAPWSRESSRRRDCVGGLRDENAGEATERPRKRALAPAASRQATSTFAWPMGFRQPSGNHHEGSYQAAALSAREAARRRHLARAPLRGRALVRAPKLFTVDELPDREAVRMRFGGGRYDLIGRDKNRIVARTRFVVDGPPLPLGDEAVASPAKRGEVRAPSPRPAARGGPSSFVSSTKAAPSRSRPRPTSRRTSCEASTSTGSPRSAGSLRRRRRRPPRTRPRAAR